MPDRFDEIIDHLRGLEDSVNAQSNQLSEIRGEMRVTCPDHARRLALLEQRPLSNANASAVMSSKLLLGLVGAITMLASIISTLVARVLGAH